MPVLFCITLQWFLKSILIPFSALEWSIANYLLYHFGTCQTFGDSLHVPGNIFLLYIFAYDIINCIGDVYVISTILGDFSYQIIHIANNLRYFLDWSLDHYFPFNYKWNAGFYARYVPNVVKPGPDFLLQWPKGRNMLPTPRTRVFGSSVARLHDMAVCYMQIVLILGSLPILWSDKNIYEYIVRNTQRH